MDETIPHEHGGSGLSAPEFRDPAQRGFCTDCGVSRLSDPSKCGQACQFIKPDYPRMETAVHGRARKIDGTDETYFGVHQKMVRARLSPERPGAQWTGITSRIGERLLETGAVDAVLTVAPHPDDRWKPQPVIVTRAEDMAQCRGMRMGFSPVVALVEEAAARGYTRLAMIGIPCQVYALRALEASLGLERLYVIGTPCSDNSTTEKFHDFLALLSDKPETISYLEFRTDYHVELRFDDGRKTAVPFLKLPISQLPPDFFPLTCRTCVDYTNSLSDITTGYMGGDGDQWLLVRNDRGAELLALIEDELSVKELNTGGNRTTHVKGFIANTERAAGGLPLRTMPDWVRPIVAWLMPKIGPKGLEFARTRVEMKAAETVIHLRRQTPAKMKNMIPDHVWKLVAPYGITPTDGETRD